MLLKAKPQDGYCLYHCLASILDPKDDEAVRYARAPPSNQHVGELVDIQAAQRELRRACDIKAKILKYMVDHPANFEELLPELGNGTVQRMSDYCAEKSKVNLWL